MDEQELFANKKESAGHKIGKRIAKVLLKNKRFRTNEIKEEYPIIFPSGRIRIIDVVGISEPIGKKFAYEIGVLNGGSLEELYVLFDEVYHLPKIEDLNEIGKFINKIQERNLLIEENFKNEIKFNQERIEYLEDYILENCETIPPGIVMGLDLETDQGKEAMKELRKIIDGEKI